MDYNVIIGLVERLSVSPKKGTKLALFLDRLRDENENQSNSNAQEGLDTAELIKDADREIMVHLKRLQVIMLTKPILVSCMQAKTPQDLNKVKGAGIESFLEMPNHISTKLNSLATNLDESDRNLTEIRDAGAYELSKKFNLVAPPKGLEFSLLLTMIFAAVTFLAFIILKAKHMLGTTEAYWGFFSAGIFILLGVNAVIINLVKVLRFNKNKDSIFIEAKRKYLELIESRHAKLKTKIDEQCFQIQKTEYSKGAQLMIQELEEEEHKIRQSFLQ